MLLIRNQEQKHFMNSAIEKFRKWIKGAVCKTGQRENYKGLFELRIKFSSDIARIFYFIYYDKRVILLSGFIKKTVKTPKIELNRAKKYMDDYKRRNNCEK